MKTVTIFKTASGQYLGVFADGNDLERIEMLPDHGTGIDFPELNEYAPHYDSYRVVMGGQRPAEGTVTISVPANAKLSQIGKAFRDELDKYRDGRGTE